MGAIEVEKEKKYQDKTVLCFDFGSQVAVAQKLSEQFGRVMLYIPSVTNGYKDHRATDIGRNVPGVERVQDWWPYYEQIDLFVFTDIYMGGLQDFLRRQGKNVFGSGSAGSLEMERVEFLELIKSLGLPTLKYDIAYGVDELDEKLKYVEDKYIKAKLRGDFETMHHINYPLSKIELKRMKHDMGVYDNKETYIICDPIDAISELGYCGYCIDGAYPDKTICGLEIKDSGYIGRITRKDYLPSQITDSMNALAPILQSYGYRSAFHTEVRVDKDKVGYFIDPTLRFGEPNTALTLEMYDNFCEIVWDVARGVVPKIKYTYEWGVEFIIKSDLAKTEPCAIQFPKEYEKNIKIKNLVIDDDGTYFYTNNGVEMCEVGAVVACGHTMDEAVKMATEIAKTVKGHDLHINTDCIEDAKKQMDELRKYGIRFI